PPLRRESNPANRCSSGSPAVDHIEGAEPQQRRDDRLQPDLRPATGRRPPLVRIAARTRRRLAREDPRPPRFGLVARAGLRPPRPRGRPPRHQPREHLPLPPRPEEADQRWPLVPLPAARPPEARLAPQTPRTDPLPRAKVGPRPPRRSRRSLQRRPLGGRRDALLDARPGRARRPRTQLEDHAPGPSAKPQGRPDRRSARSHAEARAPAP